MPAFCMMTAKAPGFSGHAMISPALCMSSTSAPSTSHGVLTVNPTLSLISSSMKSMLSLTTVGRHAGGGAHLELQHRAVGVSLRGRDPQLLAEELAQLVRDEAVVDADRARLAAAPAEGAAVGQLGEAGEGVPVQLRRARERGLDRVAARAVAGERARAGRRPGRSAGRPRSGRSSRRSGRPRRRSGSGCSGRG